MSNSAKPAPSKKSSLVEWLSLSFAVLAFLVAGWSAFVSWDSLRQTKNNSLGAQLISTCSDAMRFSKQISWFSGDAQFSADRGDELKIRMVEFIGLSSKIRFLAESLSSDDFDNTPFPALWDLELKRSPSLTISDFSDGETAYAFTKSQVQDIANYCEKGMKETR